MVAAPVELPHRLDLRVPGEAEGGAEREVDRRVLVAPERDRESGLGIADRRVGVERRRHGRSQQRGNCQESEKGLTHFQTSLENQDHRSSLTACRPKLRPCPERSEERRVGKECVGTVRSRWSQSTQTNK